MIPIGFHLFLSKWIFVWFLSTLLGLIDWDCHILRKAGIITSYDPSECWTECITRRIIWATKVHGFLQMRWKIVEKFCDSVWKELKKTGKRKKKTLGFFLALPIYQKKHGTSSHGSSSLQTLSTKLAGKWSRQSPNVSSHHWKPEVPLWKILSCLKMFCMACLDSSM